MKFNRTLAAAALALSPPSAPAIAHHATSTFYTDEIIEVSGTIQELIWANPHGIVVVQDADGNYWVGEMSAVVDLARQGLSPDLLPEGTDLTIKALSSRDGSNRIHVEEIIRGGEVIYGTAD